MLDIEHNREWEQLQIRHAIVGDSIMPKVEIIGMPRSDYARVRRLPTTISCRFCSM
jgi:hypothetical protein